MPKRKTIAHLLLIIITICSVCCASQKKSAAPDNPRDSAQAGTGREPVSERAITNKTPAPPVAKNTPQAAQTDESFFYHMSLAYGAALKRYLAAKPGIRPAQISDYDGVKNNPLPKDTGNKSYHPFYTEGDFNSDGKPEYAVILIDAKGKRSLAVFNQALNDGDSPEPIFTTGNLADYDTLSFDEEFKALIVAPVQSDNGYYLKPSGKTYKITPISEE